MTTNEDIINEGEEQETDSLPVEYDETAGFVFSLDADVSDLESDPIPEDLAEFGDTVTSARKAVSVLTGSQVVSILRQLGWRIRSGSELRQAIGNFQAGYNLGHWLAIDGKVGPATSNALRTSYSRKKGNAGTASANFSFSDFMCKCGGRHSCQRIWIKRSQIAKLEQYRSHKKGPVKVISACRCREHNRAVGGASNSQHLYGVATDIAPDVDKDTLSRWHIFSGIGFNQSSDKASHVDSRRGSVFSPTVWRYGR